MLKTTPRPHQAEAIEVALSRPGTLIDGKMGAGKTLIALGSIARSRAIATLVLCPKSVRGVWRREVRKHTESIDVIAPEKGDAKRKAQEIQQHIEQARLTKRPFVIVVNYDTARCEQMAKVLLGVHWHCIIADECHRLKGVSGKTSRFARKLKARRRLGLSGTPTPHSPLDLWAQAQFIAPGTFQRTFTAFRSNYAVVINCGFPKIIGWQNQDDYQVRRLQLVHDCGDVDLHLPPLTDQTVDVVLESKADKAYCGLERDFYAEVESGEVTAANALTKILRLQQLTGGTIKLDDGKMCEVSTAKREALADILGDLSGKKVVVFCRFTSDLDAVRSVAEEAKLVYGEISGKRSDGLDNNGMMAEGIDLVGVQVQSGGSGIDLTAASVGIFYSLNHSLGDHEQCKARLHRPGQRLHTHLIYLAAKKTIDEKILEALVEKKNVIETVVYGKKNV